MRPISVVTVLLLLLSLALLCAAPASVWAAPTCEAGPDLSVAADELGGSVVHGTVSNASYYLWAAWDDTTQWWTLLTECDVPVGPGGAADLTLSAGQLTPGVHVLQLGAKVLPSGQVGYCGDSAADTMTLVVTYTGAPTIERYRVGHVSHFWHGSPELEDLYRTIQVGVRVWGATAAGVTVVDSAGAAHPNATPADQGPEGYGCFCTQWDEEDELAPAAGPYTVIAHGTAADDSDAAVLITQSHKQFVDPPLPHITYPTPGSATMGTALEMTWDEFSGFSGGETSTVDYRGVGVAGPVGCVKQCGLRADQLSAEFAGLEPGQEYLAHLAMFGEGIAELAQDGVTPGSYQEIAADLVVFYVYSPVPAIQSVSILPFHTVTPDTEFWSECAQITARDLDGWDDIVAITTLNPNGDPRPSPDGCSWTSDDGHYTVYRGWGEWEGETTPILPGDYGVTAEDLEGHISAPVTASFFEWPPMHNILYPADGSVIEETVPVFTWEAVSGAEQLEVWLLEQGPEGLSTVWRRFGIPGDATGITYNDDGTATQPGLRPGSHYQLRVEAFYPDQDPSPQASVAPVNERVVNFTVGSQPPAIDKLEVGRGRNTSPEGTVSYSGYWKTFVNDPDGLGDIASVVIADPQGQEYEAWKMCDREDGTAAYCWMPSGEAPTPAGTYFSTVTDWSGNSASLSVLVSEIPDNTPVLLTPPANYSVAPNPPYFTWSGPADACYCLWVSEPGEGCPIWCSGGRMEGTAGALAYGGSELVPGHLYEWRVNLSIPDGEQSDPRVVAYSSPTAYGRFWLEPKFVGLLEPINDDGSSIFELGSTVPVKFQLIGADGNQVTDATCELHLIRVTDDITGTYQEAVSTSAADSGNRFRYADDHYQFNLSTKVLSTGTYRLRVTVNGATAHETTISLR